jgi:hypothetical protein
MNFRRIFLTAAMAVTATGLASADSIVTQSFSLPSTSDTTTWTGTFAVNQFDTTLGNLQYIEIIGKANTVVNAGAVDATGDTGGDTYVVTGTTNLTLADPSSSNLLVAPTTSVVSTFTNQSNGSSMFVSNQSATNTQTAYWIIDPSLTASLCGGFTHPQGCLDKNDSTGNTSGLINPLDYTNYEGPGKYTLTGTGSTAGSFSGPSYSGAFSNGTADLLVTVIYDYIATTSGGTPEPTTMVLFGTGLVAVGLIRRRLKTR